MRLDARQRAAYDGLMEPVTLNGQSLTLAEIEAVSLDSCRVEIAAGSPSAHGREPGND